MSEPNNQNNDPLEELFRKKAEEYNIPYHEEDWNKLESRLESYDQTIHRRRWQQVLAAAIVFIVALLGYSTYSNYMEINRLTELLEESTNEQVQPEQNLTVPLPEPTSPIAEARGDQTGENTSPVSGEEESALGDKSSVPGSDESNEPLEFALSKEESESLYQNEFNCAYCRLSEETFTEVYPPKVTSDAIVSGQDGTFASNRSAPAGNVPDIVSSGPRITLGLVLGPDLSTVGSLADFENPGYKIGFMAEWNISKNLSVAAGAVRSKIQYNAQGSDYHPPEGYWSEGIIPDHAFGVCHLIDIPINLKYVMHHFTRSRLYASAGVSSYIMLSEDYQFTYDEPIYGQSNRWSGETGTRHWLSSGTFSVGYERDLNPKVSLRIEPFIKMPLQEVGWGNVELYSIGSLVSINYGF